MKGKKNKIYHTVQSPAILRQWLVCPYIPKLRSEKKTAECLDTARINAAGIGFG